MPGFYYRTLFDLAVDQHGYFVVTQARDAGVSEMALVMMARRGALERMSHGVYRLAQFPFSAWGQYMEAALWPGGGVRGVISHESALAMYEVSDVSPAKIHVTVPRSYRTHRRVPAHLVLHRADLAETETGVLEGVPVTTLERAVRDCAQAHLGAGLLRDAIDDGRRLGLLSQSAARRLRLQLPR